MDNMRSAATDKALGPGARPHRAGPPLGMPGTAGLYLTIGGLMAYLAWLGRHVVFSQFQWYDDEGYLLVTVQQFLQGRTLYDDVYSQYGPGYYLWQQLLHGTLGVPLTNDATRMVTVVIWLLCSALACVPVWLLTRRVLLTAIGLTIAFFHVTQLTFEPGHPQELSLIAVTGVIALTMWRLVDHGSLGVRSTIALGAMIAFTVLTKVNIGAFLAGATTLALVMSLGRSPARTVLVRVFAVAAAGGVPALMHGDLSRGDIAAWVVVVWCALLAAFVAGVDDGGLTHGVTTAGEVIGIAAGALIGSAALIIAILGHGTSLRALFDGTIVWPARLSAVFWQPLPVPLVAAALAPLAVVAAVSRRRGVAVVGRYLPIVAVVLGTAVCLLSVGKAYGTLLASGPLLAWLALGDVSLAPRERAARRMLVFAAVLMALQVYPVPEGTQITLGTLLFVPVALVTIGDADRELRARRAVETPRPSPIRRATFATLAVAIAALVGVVFERRHDLGTPLGFPGAMAVRTTERDASTYRWLTMNIREHCERFLTAPGFNSLHLWTGIPPVSTFNATLWPILFDEAQQRRVLEAAGPVGRLCVPWDPRKMAILTRVPDTASLPLVAWLAREFRPVARVGAWEFRTRRTSHPTPTLTYQGTRLDDGGVILDVPPLGHDMVTRVEVVDLDAARTLGDSARQGSVVVVDELGADAGIVSGLDMSRRRRVIVRGAAAAPASVSSFVVVRLWTRSGRLIASVPLATDLLEGPCERSDPNPGTIGDIRGFRR